MYSKELLEKYADVLIEKGVNIQKGQYLLLKIEFVRLIRFLVCFLLMKKLCIMNLVPKK